MQDTYAGTPFPSSCSPVTQQAGAEHLLCVRHAARPLGGLAGRQSTSLLPEKTDQNRGETPTRKVRGGGSKHQRKTHGSAGMTDTKLARASAPAAPRT